MSDDKKYWNYLAHKYIPLLKRYVDEPIVNFSRANHSADTLYRDMEAVVALYTILILKKMFLHDTFVLLRDMSKYLIDCYLDGDFSYLVGYRKPALPFLLSVLEELADFKEFPDELKVRLYTNSYNPNRECSLFKEKPRKGRIYYVIYNNGDRSDYWNQEKLVQFQHTQRSNLRELFKNRKKLRKMLRFNATLKRRKQYYKQKDFYLEF